MTDPGGEHRRTAPPEVVERWVERWTGPSDDGVGGDVTAQALNALSEACSRTGRNREAAEALLASDALLTERVEDLAAADDPEGGLTKLLRAVVQKADG